MKKILSLSLCLGAVSAMAEVKPYFGASLGYTLGQPSGRLGSESTNTSSKAVYGTLAGNAVPLSIHGGVMDNGVFGGELAATYLMGLEQETSKSSGTLNYSDKATLSGILLTPSIVIAAKGPFTPYAKFGFVMGLGMKATAKTTGDISSSDEVTGGMAFGFQGAAGAEFKLQEKLGLTVELAAQALKWAPTESKETDEDGTTITTTYVDDHTFTTKNESLKFVQDLSNLAIKIGVNYHL